MALRNVGVLQERRIEFRLGINVGDVVVEDGDIFGDGVNIAVRLEGLARPGGICVAERVQEDAAGKLDIAFANLGVQPLKNIVRPVRVFRVAPSNAVSSVEILTEAPGLPNKPSVAVLPFNNMSADPEQEFFADGIAEDIITAMSRYPSLFVIARNSSFTYKGRPVDVKQVGRELGVRYVLEGSLRKSGNRIRVTAQLIESESGNHVWAERYDRDLADMFAVQEDITEAVTIAVAPAIANAELRRAIRKPPGSLDAWGAFQRGLWHMKSFSLHENAEAQKFFQRCIPPRPEFRWRLLVGSPGLSCAATGLQNCDLLETQSSAEKLTRRAVG